MPCAHGPSRCPGWTASSCAERVIGARPDIPVVVFTDTARSTWPFARCDGANRLSHQATGRQLFSSSYAAQSSVDGSHASRTLAVSPSGDAEDGIREQRRDASRVRPRPSRRVASSEASVPIQGETAPARAHSRAIHRQSARAEAVGRGELRLIQPNLPESEPFGYVRGAFTDARRQEGSSSRPRAERSSSTRWASPLDVQPKPPCAPADDLTCWPDQEFYIRRPDRLGDEPRARRRRLRGYSARILTTAPNVVRIDVPAVRERDADVPAPSHFRPLRDAARSSAVHAQCLRSREPSHIRGRGTSVRSKRDGAGRRAV